MHARLLVHPLALGAALALWLGAAGCAHHHHHHPAPAPPRAHVEHRQGPPPWAPAHGYRHKHRHHGPDLVFDAGIGVYVVVGHPLHYFHHDHYYRLHQGAWQISARLVGPWGQVDVGRVPSGLRKHHAKHHPHKRHGKWKKHR